MKTAARSASELAAAVLVLTALSAVAAGRAYAAPAKAATTGARASTAAPVPATDTARRADDPARLPEAATESTAHVILTTPLGEIELELDVRRAPVTTRNFLRYVDAGRYDGGAFHRTVRAGNQPRNPVKIAVVQASVAPSWADRDFPPIALEPTGRTGLRHRDGTISMARAAPDTATSDFFICVGDQPELDEGGRRNPDGRGFAAFGRVIRGMDVVRRINAAPADGQTLQPPIEIAKARVIGSGK